MRRVSHEQLLEAWWARHRVWLPTGLTAATLLAMLWSGIYWHLAERERSALEQADRDVANLSIALREEVEHTLDGVDRLLRFVAEDQRTNLGNVAFARWAERAANWRDVVVALAMTDASGRVVGTSLTPTNEPVSLSDRSYFRAHAERGDVGLHVARTVFGRVSQTWVFQLSRRLENPDGSFAGVVFASVDAERMAARFAALDVGPGGNVTLLGQDGHIRARTPGFPGMYDRNMRETAAGKVLFERLEAQGDNTCRTCSGADGAPRVFGQRKLESMPLVVAVGQSVADILAPLDSERQRLEVLGVIATMVIGALVVALAIELRLRQRDAWRLRALHAEVAAAEVRAVDSAARAERFNEYLLSAEKVAQFGYWRFEVPFSNLFWSPEVFRIYGVPVSSGAPSVETAIVGYHPEDRPAVERFLQAAVERGQSFEYRARIVRPSGEVREVLVRGRVQRGPRAEILAVYGAIMDTSELRRARRALEATEASLELVAETTKEVVIRLGLDFRRISVSASCRELLGYAPEEMVGQLPSTIMDPDDVNWTRELMQKLANGEFVGDRAVITHRVRHRAGHWVWVQARMALARDGRREPASVLVFMRGVTDEADAPPNERGSRVTRALPSPAAAPSEAEPVA